MGWTPSQNWPPRPERRRLPQVASTVLVLGLVTAVAGHIWNSRPLPPDDGANIGAAGLELLGTCVAVAGLIMLGVAGFQLLRRRRR